MPEDESEHADCCNAETEADLRSRLETAVTALRIIKTRFYTEDRFGTKGASDEMRDWAQRIEATLREIEELW